MFIVTFFKLIILGIVTFVSILGVMFFGNWEFPKEKIINAYNSFIEHFDTKGLSKDKDIQGKRTFGIDKYIGTYQAKLMSNEVVGGSIMKSEILKCLGKFPEKTSLEVKEINKIDYGDYNEILLEYNVEIGERVRSYILIPKKEGIKPAIVAIHQHASNWDIGKSEVVGKMDNKMFAYGLDLVKKGYVVIAPDLLCFESRQGNENLEQIKKCKKCMKDLNFVNIF